MIKEIKGWHVLSGFVFAFGIIISVNLTLAVKAVGTFPGLEVKKVAPVKAGAGNWNLRVKMRAENGTLFQQRIVVEVVR